MNIRKTIITATVALTTVAMIAPMSAGALTIAELQAQINALMAQLQMLQSPSTPSGNVPAACVGVTFTRNLTVGSTGQDVKCFQALMNTHGYQLAASGAGSPGNETMYFGPLTLGAVRRLQVAQGWAPANQVGPLTRALFNSWLSGSPVNPNPNVPPVVVPTGSGLWVGLSANTPVSGTVVAGQALAHLADFTFTNGDNATVKVTNLKLTRTGVSADSTLANVYLFQGANRLTDAASVSTSMITFNDSNGVFTVDPGATKTISVYSDLASAAGETVGVSIVTASNVTSNSSSIKGTFPINGNQMLLASATLASVTLATTSTPSTATINPMKDTVVWENLTVIGTRQVWLKWLRLREIGTINYSDLANFRLYVDGVQVGSPVASLDSNGYVTFDLTSAPVSLNTGTRDIKVLADVIGGSFRNFSFSLRVASDLNVVDSQYGANILATVNSSSFPSTAGTETIASGTITVQKAPTSPSGDVVNTASNALLGKFILTAAGERVKIDTLRAGVVCSAGVAANTGLRNGALYANGVQIGSTSTLNCITATTTTTGYTSFNMGSSLIVDPMTPVTVEIRADIYATGSTALVAGTDTLTGVLVTGASGNGQGQVSLQTVTVPSVNVAANSLSIKAGSLILSKYTAYTNQVVVPPLTNFKIGHFTLTASTTEAINLSSIIVDNTFTSGWLNNMYVKYGTQETIKTANPTSSTTYSINSQLAPGQTIDVMVFADVVSTASGSGVASSVEFTGTTVGSGTAVTTNSSAVLAGQSVNFSTGTFNAIVDGTTPINQVVAGNQSVVAGKFKFTASNDNYTLTETAFTVQGNNGAVINSASLWDGSTLLATQPFDSANNRIYFTGLNVPVAANTNKVLSVSLALATPYTDGTTVTTGKNLAITLAYIKTLNGTGVMRDAGNTSVVTLQSTNAAVTIASSTTGTSAGNYLYVYKSVPTFTVGSVSSGQGTALTAGTTTELYKFSVAADSRGPIAMKQLKFVITTNDINTGTLAQLSTFKFFKGSTDITSSVTIMNTSGTSLESTTSVASATVVVNFYPEEVVSAGSTTTYTLKATPSGYTCASGTCDSVSTVLSQPTDTTPAGVSAGADAARYYIDSVSNVTVATLFTSAAGAGTGTAADVIWSDNSGQSHSETFGGSSADWFNGYLQLNLPLDSIGVVAS